MPSDIRLEKEKNLKKKKRINEGTNPYPCQSRIKRFNLYENLRRHESIETNENPYPC